MLIICRNKKKIFTAIVLNNVYRVINVYSNYFIGSLVLIIKFLDENFKI